MVGKKRIYLLAVAALTAGSMTWVSAKPKQQSTPRVHVSVEMVQLYAAVTD